MAGTTLLAYGVVFVLLIGEIDLSIALCQRRLRRRRGGVRSCPEAATSTPRSSRLSLAIAIGIAIGAFQGSIIALIGVPSFVVTLAGFQIWQGVILKSIPQGVILIQDRPINNIGELLLQRHGRLDHRRDHHRRCYVGSTLIGVVQGRRHGVADPRPAASSWLKLIGVPLVTVRHGRHLQQATAACRSRRCS